MSDHDTPYLRALGRLVTAFVGSLIDHDAMMLRDGVPLGDCTAASEGLLDALKDDLRTLERLKDHSQ